MNIFFIANFNTRKKGGLFNATYERLKRVSNNLDNYYVINNNSYDSKIVVLLKQIFRKKPIHIKVSEDEFYNDIKIYNSNCKRDIIYYLMRVFRWGKTYKRVVNLYISKYHKYLVNADIIHAHWGWPNSYIAYQLSIIYKKPYCITFHGSDINKIKKHNINKLITVMENAETCFFVSNKLLETAKLLGYSGKNSKISYNGVDSKKFKPTEYINNNTVGYVGTLEKIKGADFLPQIFNEIHKLNKRARFIIVGDGSLKESIKKEINELGIKVKFTGNVSPESVPQLLEKMNVIVVPSRNEGLPLIIVESYAMGIPVVGSDVGGIPEAIGFKNNIIKTDNNLIKNIAVRVNEILSFEIDYDYSKKYRDKVITKFNWDEIVKDEISTYNKIYNRLK